MTSPEIEQERGRKEAGQQLGVLRERWPLAFPVQAQDVRPLAMSVANQIAETMGWTLSYSVGVLTIWKMSTTYCRAVLNRDQRITLDGTPVEAIDDGAKDLAAKQRYGSRYGNAAKQNSLTKAKLKVRCLKTPRAGPQGTPAHTRGEAFPGRDRDGLETDLGGPAPPFLSQSRFLPHFAPTRRVRIPFFLLYPDGEDTSGTDRQDAVR